VPDSAGFDLVSGFAFFVEVAAVDVGYDRDGKHFHLQAPKGSSAKLFIGYHIRLLDAPGNYGAPAPIRTTEGMMVR